MFPHTVVPSLPPVKRLTPRAVVLLPKERDERFLLSHEHACTGTKYKRGAQSHSTVRGTGWVMHSRSLGAFQDRLMGVRVGG